VRIILDVRIRHQVDLIEWKVAHLAGEPTSMLRAIQALSHGTLAASHGPIVAQNLRMLLEEHCEPF
jgi:hypothetical protein